MKVYEPIPKTEKIKASHPDWFRLFGLGNEKRDMTLLVRGDLMIDKPCCVSFFGCIECGYMATGTARFSKCDGRITCLECGTEDTVWYFDGVWKHTEGIVCKGTTDKRVTVVKM